MWQFWVWERNGAGLGFDKSPSELIQSQQKGNVSQWTEQYRSPPSPQGRFYTSGVNVCRASRVQEMFPKNFQKVFIFTIDQLAKGQMNRICF